MCFQAGEWKISISENEAIEPYRYTLQGYGETNDESSNLVISASFGRKLNGELYPSIGGLPVYVSVRLIIY